MEKQKEKKRSLKPFLYKVLIASFCAYYGSNVLNWSCSVEFDALIDAAMLGLMFATLMNAIAYEPVFRMIREHKSWKEKSLEKQLECAELLLDLSQEQITVHKDHAEEIGKLHNEATKIAQKAVDLSNEMTDKYEKQLKINTDLQAGMDAE